MPDKPLSMKRQHFCREYHTNGHNGSEAYRVAYPGCRVGHNVNASRLLTNDSIRSELSRLEAMTVVRGEYTVDACDKEYSDIIALAIQLKQPSAAVSAITGRARLRGWDKDTQVNTEEPTDLNSDEATLYKEMAQQAIRNRLKISKEA